MCILKIEAENYSETLLATYKIKLFHKKENSNTHVTSNFH
jgi:hypothetical protein